MQSDGPRTYSNLLVNLAQSDNDAWDKFFELYYPMITNWARYFGCPSGMEDDVFQEVVMSLVRQMDDFEYDPDKGSFRGLLKTITRHKVYDIFRRRREYQGPEYEDSDTSWEDSVQDTNETTPGEAMDQVSIRVALHKALRQAREKVTPRTAEMFERYRIQDQAPEKVAESMGVPVQTVYEAVRRFRSDYLAPCFLAVLQELDDSVNEAVSSKVLNRALDDMVRGQSQFLVTAVAPVLDDVRDRIRNLPETAARSHSPGHAGSWLEVTAAPDGAEVAVGDTVSLYGQEMVIGRLEGLDLTLTSTQVSGRHATLMYLAPSWYIRDDRSANGTLVNDSPLESVRVLSQDDIIQIGDFTFIFRSQKWSKTNASG